MNWPKQKCAVLGMLPLSWLYQIVIGCRNFCYDKNILAATRAPAKVVSIGNLSVGGSGKTPTTAYLANALTEQGVKVAIVARGYGRKGRSECIVSDGQTVLAEIHEAGDEPLLLARQCPRVAVVVAESKTRAAQIAAERFQPQIILVDDGFQHRRLHRDLDLLLISARMLLQKPWLLPAGPLREPLHNIRRADKILLTEIQSLNLEQRQTIFDLLRRHTTASILPVAFVADGIRPLFEGKALATFRPQHTTALLVSGIALPERFRKTAEANNVIVREHLIYRDHHAYTERDVETLLRKFQNAQADYLLTTAKDAVKLRRHVRLQVVPIYVLELRFSAEATALAELMNAVLADASA
ncbi:MAG: tetraacyldisaccharide 4'-kinase [candidate division KSB1 bacterium]